jgi:hypothetical protein
MASTEEMRLIVLMTGQQTDTAAKILHIHMSNLKNMSNPLSTSDPFWYVYTSQPPFNIKKSVWEDTKCHKIVERYDVMAYGAELLEKIREIESCERVSAMYEKYGIPRTGHFLESNFLKSIQCDVNHLFDRMDKSSNENTKTASAIARAYFDAACNVDRKAIETPSMFNTFVESSGIPAKWKHNLDKKKILIHCGADTDDAAAILEEKYFVERKRPDGTIERKEKTYARAIEFFSKAFAPGDGSLADVVNAIAFAMDTKLGVGYTIGDVANMLSMFRERLSDPNFQFRTPDVMLMDGELDDFRAYAILSALTNKKIDLILQMPNLQCDSDEFIIAKALSWCKCHEFRFFADEQSGNHLNFNIAVSRL